MFVDGEIRHFPGIAVVALFAAIAPRVGGELSLVLILVAIQAGGKLDLVFGVFAGWNMAGGALHIGVRRNQRVLGLGVVRSRECGRAPSLHGMAALAAALVRALGKLAAVLVFVAIGARFERDLGLEIAALVAVEARYLKMLSHQRVVGLGVVKLGGEGRPRPARRGVAGLAALFEFALVRIGVAIRAVLELEACVARLAIVTGGMALGAGSGHVLAR